MLDYANSLLDLHVAQFELFMLVLIRMSGMIFLFPFFNNEAVLSRFKVGFAFILSIIIFPSVKDSAIPYTPEVGHLILIVVKELAIGMTIGFGASFLFVFLALGGEVINRNIGLSMMPVLDPMSGENSTNLTQLLIFLFTIAFLLKNQHFFFIEIMAESFEYIPITGFQFDTKEISHILSYMVGESLLVGMRIAAPVLVTTLLALLGLAFMSRAMPNLNVWMMSLPVKIVVGMMTLVYVLPMMYQVFDRYFTKLQWNILAIMKIIGGEA